MMKMFRGYRIRASASGYSVYHDDVCVAAGGLLAAGEVGNMTAGKKAVAELIAGKRKPLNPPPTAEERERKERIRARLREVADFLK